MFIVSVIVPVYNVENFICECIDSILNQTYNYLEIILIDDGSKDRSGELCDKYANIDNRVTVIHKKNGGLSDARNYGLNIASGDFVSFIDSDDYVDNNYIEELLMAIVSNNSDIAVAAIQHFNEKRMLNKRKIETECSLSKDEAIKELFYSKNISNSVCNKLFKRHLFDNIRFPINKLYEDEYVTYKLFHLAQKVSFVNKVSYYYRFNAKSITHSKFSEKELDRVYASIEKIDFCKRYYPSYVSLVQCYLVYDCISAIIKMDKYDKNYDSIIGASIRNNLIVYLLGGNSFLSKGFAILAALSPSIAVKCYNLAKYFI